MDLKHRKPIRAIAGALSVLTAAMSLSAFPAGALVTDAAGDYDNFAKALQYSLHFYDANMCGPEVEDHSRFAWRANCHTYDAEVPLKYGIVHVDAVVAGYNLQGGENEFKHVENGITREFNYASMVDYIHAHVKQLVKT